jgi:hypothetical protein
LVKTLVSGLSSTVTGKLIKAPNESRPPTLRPRVLRSNAIHWVMESLSICIWFHAEPPSEVTLQACSLLLIGFEEEFTRHPIGDYGHWPFRVNY